jgi:hypothetical protein
LALVAHPVSKLHLWSATAAAAVATAPPAVAPPEPVVTAVAPAATTATAAASSFAAAAAPFATTAAFGLFNPELAAHELLVVHFLDGVLGNENGHAKKKGKRWENKS